MCANADDEEGDICKAALLEEISKNQAKADGDKCEVVAKVAEHGGVGLENGLLVWLAKLDKAGHFKVYITNHTTVPLDISLCDTYEFGPTVEVGRRELVMEVFQYGWKAHQLYFNNDRDNKLTLFFEGVTMQ